LLYIRLQKESTLTYHRSGESKAAHLHSKQDR
jgi:hypothetical protein